MKGWLLLDVIVRKGSAVFKLLTGEDKSLLIGRNTFFVLDLGLYIFNCIRWLNVKGDGLASQGLNEDLHTSSKSQNQMKGRFFLNVVVGESSTVFKLLSSKDKSLLIGWNTFFILDLCFHILDCVWWFNIESDGLASKSLDEDLHATSKSQDQMECRFFLNVIVRKGSAIF